MKLVMSSSGREPTLSLRTGHRPCSGRRRRYVCPCDESGAMSSNRRIERSEGKGWLSFFDLNQVHTTRSRPAPVRPVEPSLRCSSEISPRPDQALRLDAVGSHGSAAPSTTETLVVTVTGRAPGLGNSIGSSRVVADVESAISGRQTCELSG